MLVFSLCARSCECSFLVAQNFLPYRKTEEFYKKSRVRWFFWAIFFQKKCREMDSFNTT